MLLFQLLLANVGGRSPFARVKTLVTEELAPLINKTMLGQSGRAVSAGELAEHLYGAAEDGDTNAIEAIVARLRRKFGAELIATRRGFGYLLETSA